MYVWYLWHDHRKMVEITPNGIKPQLIFGMFLQDWPVSVMWGDQHHVYDYHYVCRHYQDLPPHCGGLCVGGNHAWAQGRSLCTFFSWRRFLILIVHYRKAFWWLIFNQSSWHSSEVNTVLYVFQNLKYWCKSRVIKNHNLSGELKEIRRTKLSLMWNKGFNTWSYFRQKFDFDVIFVSLQLYPEDQAPIVNLILFGLVSMCLVCALFAFSKSEHLGCKFEKNILTV